MSTLEKAIAIAASAHERQLDKAGQPYILHPLRVMMKMDTQIERIVAVLHDVVEDAGPDWDFERLRLAGFEEEVIEALRHLTRDAGRDTYMEYIERIRGNKAALRVKLADLEDNLDLTRISLPTEADFRRCEKYLKAYQFLKEPQQPI